MIKNKYKKIVSAMLLMTMIATTFSVDVFAGGGASCISVECEGLFKGCCTKERSDSSKTECRATPTTPSSIAVNGSGNSVINGSNTIIINQMQPQDEKEGHLVIGKEIEKKVVTDPITPPAPQPEPVSTHNDNKNYRFNEGTGHLTLLSNYKGTEPISSYMDKSQLESIKTVNIERGVVRLVGTFHECYHLTSVIISDTVKEIGENAFADCKDLESIKIPASVTKIDAYAFKGCTSLTEVIIPDSVTEISEHAFDGCPFKPHKSDPPPEPHKSDVVIDPISPPTSFIPTEVTKVDNSIQTSEPEVVIDPISPPTNIISTETDRMDNSVQASEEVAKTDNSIQACEEIVKVDNSTQASEEVAKTDNSVQTCKEDITLSQIPDDKGSCGDNVNYLFYKSTGELVIQGKGAMEDYSSSENFPWYEYKNKIKSVNVEDGVTYIGEMAFQDCTGLTSINISNSVISIEKGAFWGCGSLTSITIPNSVTYIGSDAFSGCTGLKEVKIPDSVTSIGEWAFSDCRGLISINIPKSVTSIGEAAFRRTFNLTSINVDAKNKEYKSIDGVLFSKDGTKLIECPKGKNATYTIPDSVKEIDECAFYFCSGLTSINVDARNPYLKSIDGVLFSKDGTELRKYPAGKKATNYIIPKSVTSIGEDAFNDCDGLISVTIGNGVKEIGRNAFRDCRGLTSITIPNSVTKIDWCAFYCCMGLTSVTIGNAVKEISDSAFGECDGLTSINVDARNPYLKSIDGVLFSKDGTKLLQFPIGKRETNYIIPKSVTSISNSAFEGCKGLTSVTIGNGVKEIAYGAFFRCSGLKEVTIPRRFDIADVFNEHVKINRK